MANELSESDSAGAYRGSANKINEHAIRRWVERRGFPLSSEDDKTLCISWTAEFVTKNPLPPLFVQVAENWVVLSVLSVKISPSYSLVGTSHALLSFNRKMKVVKFALGEADEVVLCAELPTESLDEDEFLGVVDALLSSLERYGDYSKKGAKE